MQKVAFYDELGNQQEFIVKAKFSLDDVDYVAMLPADEIYAPTYILRVDIDDSGEEILVGIISNKKRLVQSSCRSCCH